MGKTVINGVIPYLSASQMQLADDTRPFIDQTEDDSKSEPGCLSRWVYKYVVGLPDHETGGGAQRGIEGHARLEEYLGGGPNILDPLEMEGVLLGHVPKPGNDLLLEQPLALNYDVPTKNQIGWFNSVTALGIPMTGYIDCVNPRSLANGGILELIDWKFKKSIKDYGVRKNDLINPNHEAGIQMIAYGKWAAENAAMFPGLRFIRLTHVTFQTKGKKLVERISVMSDLTEIRKLWDILSRRIVPRMQQAATQKPSTVAKNHENCWKYPRLGCPYKNPCLDPMAVFASAMISKPKELSPMGMLTGIMNGTSAVPAPPPAPTTAVGPIVPKIKIEDLGTPEIAASSATPACKYHVGPAVATFLVMNGDQALFIPVAGGAPFQIPGGTLVRPFTESAAAGTAPPPAQVATTPPPTPAPLVATVPTTPPAPVVPVTTAAAPQPEAPATEPAPKRARKAKAESPGPIETKSDTTEADGIYMYFGCSPVGIQVNTLHSFMTECEAATVKAALEKNIQGAYEGMDLRTSEGNGLGFGKWKGFLSYFAKNLPIAPGHYVVTPGDERIDTCAHALMGLLPPGHLVMGGGR